MLLAGIVLFATCQVQAEEFALPQGDPEVGRETFIALGCTQCHSVAGEIELDSISETGTHFALGGYVIKGRTDGDLVTSIINPSHKVSSSRIAKGLRNETGGTNMVEINRLMTVAELIDITSYLKDTYKIVSPREGHPN